MQRLFISKARYGEHHFEDNSLIDRLNSRYTIIGLIMAIGVIMAGLFIGDSINCWTPAQFTGMHDNYAHSFCWLKGTYYLPTDEIIIPDRSKPRIYYVSYYQWTPFILLGMSFLFLIPQFLWQIFMRCFSLNLRRLVHQLKTRSNPPEDLRLVGEALENYFYIRNAKLYPICLPNLTIIYFIMKFLYLINTFVQFIVLNAFLSFQFTSHGFEAMKKLFSGADWFESPRFPRVTMCDFMIRHLGSNQHWYALQCNLPINMYNEKIFLIIWIWLIILTILNIISLISWFISLTRRIRLSTIRRYVSETSSNTKRSIDPQDLVNYLKTDGFLILRLIAENTDEKLAGEILVLLNSQRTELMHNESLSNA